MERDEFAALMRELQSLVFNVALAKLPPEDARDVVSETFLVVWQKRASAPADPSERRRWVWGVAHRKIQHAQQQRRRKHHDARFAHDHAAPDPVAYDDPAAVVTEAESARRAFDALPAGEREAVIAALASDLSGAEIAALLGVTPSAFASRLSRGREKIARFLYDSAPLGEGE
ncbi:RNA polymerase sigma factor [Nocardioides jejuensis]|uniref:RNA polymerase sigma factor n=1 Tax=Nocardioides jejuensis TaxID=2502782 RepID=A0A4R1CKR2_9ACTN|nr:RNA polymerase sigma factor [Nocardioides jejuensis]TCJ31035.1 RNA polymerase sigma factor [Nocardioides jejuensis]